MTQTPADAAQSISFLKYCGLLKHLERTGWVNHGVRNPEVRFSVVGDPAAYTAAVVVDPVRG